MPAVAEPPKIVQLNEDDIDDIDWLIEQSLNLTDHIETTSPSAYAEENRYLPKSVTPKPGYYNYDVMPYLQEIVDCFDVNSAIREVNVKKGAQIGYTTGVLENAMMYSIGVVKSAPTMFLTVDADVAKLRLEANVIPMIQQSGLDKHIRSSDEGNKRKTGQTDKKLEWDGGGYLLPFGAKSPGKMRSFSIRFMLEDEIDGYKEVIGKDGDPCALVEARCKSYWQVRKILRGSTPLEKGTSKIDKYFEQGDQRYYFFKCLNSECREEQALRFSIDMGEGKPKAGLKYERDEDGVLIRESVRYVCPFCGHEHKESDKRKLLAKENARWKPTVKAKKAFCRSYHISGLYSPATMFTWADCIQSYLDAWDVD
ncbi:MAG: phage terminase large subunit family protein, partial [Gammaproteobacteria bacterium]|nr:phage terminase large subunit family protein [Gammaproteobacteria bacterium]